MDRINAYRASCQIPHQPSSSAVPRPSAPGQSAALSGDGQLDQGRSVTFQAREASVLRITRGRVWLTFNWVLSAPSARSDDHFLSCGESVLLTADEAVVMESYGRAGSSSACYRWDAMPTSSAMARFAISDWRDNFVLPLRDLRLALGLTAVALGRLTRSVTVGMAEALIRTIVNFATVFIAGRARKIWIIRAFKPKSTGACVDCSGH